MGLNKLEMNAANDFTLAQCYDAVERYLKGYIPAWKESIENAKSSSDIAPRIIKGAEYNLSLAEILPTVHEAKIEDMDYVMGQVVYGKFEDFYHSVDERTIKIGAYAHRYFQLRCGSSSPNEITRESMKKSKLYKKFGMHHEYIKDV